MDRLSSLRAFQKVIEEGGFAAAARALDQSPAVVTRLVADLEEHLGTRLLHRTTRRVSLTEAGEAYLERIRQVLIDLDEAGELVSSQTRELAGVLRVLGRGVNQPVVTGPEAVHRQRLGLRNAQALQHRVWLGQGPQVHQPQQLPKQLATP